MNCSQSGTREQSDRAASFRRRISTPNDGAMRCPLPGCGRPSQARAGKGASLYHCKIHVQRRARHGSFWLGTLKAAALRPYRHAAERWLKANAEHPDVVHSMEALRLLLDTAGPGRTPLNHQDVTASREGARGLGTAAPGADTTAALTCNRAHRERRRPGGTRRAGGSARRISAGPDSQGGPPARVWLPPCWPASGLCPGREPGGTDRDRRAV